MVAVIVTVTICARITMTWYRIGTTICYEDEVASHFAILEINQATNFGTPIMTGGSIRLFEEWKNLTETATGTLQDHIRINTSRYIYRDLPDCTNAGGSSYTHFETED